MRGAGGRVAGGAVHTCVRRGSWVVRVCTYVSEVWGGLLRFAIVRLERDIFLLLLGHR